MCGGESDSQYGWTVLILATYHGRVDCAQLLIDAGADTEVKDGVRCWSLLARAPPLQCVFLYSAGLLS